MNPLVRCAWLAAIALGLTLGLGCNLGGCSRRFGHVQGSGPVVSESRPLTGECRAITATGSCTVRLIADPRPGITVAAQGELLPLVVTTYDHGTLTIGTRGSLSSTEPISVTVRAPGIHTLTLGGAVSASAEAWSGDTLTVHSQDAARATLSGHAARLDLTCAGSSRVDAARFTALSSDAKTTDASRATLGGDGRSATLQASAGSTIMAHALQVAEATLTASGAATIILGAADHAATHSSEAARITVERSTP